MIADVIAAASRDGEATSETPARDAQTVFSLVLDGIHAVSFGRADADDTATYLWRFCGRALGVPLPVTNDTEEP